MLWVLGPCVGPLAISPQYRLQNAVARTSWADLPGGLAQGTTVRRHDPCDDLIGKIGFTDDVRRFGHGERPFDAFSGGIKRAAIHMSWRAKPRRVRLRPRGRITSLGLTATAPSAEPGTFKHVREPYRFDGEPDLDVTLPPMLDEHGAEIQAVSPRRRAG